MKAFILVDIPEDDNLDMLSPFNVKVTLDYGDSVLYLSGNIIDPYEKETTETLDRD